MRAQRLVSIAAASAALLLGGGPTFAAVVDYFDVPPIRTTQAMRTSYGKVLPAGTYRLKVRQAADGTLDLLFFNPSGILIGLSKAQFRAGGTAKNGDPIPTEQLSMNYTKIRVDYTKSGASSTQNQKMKDSTAGSPGSKAQGKIEGQAGSQVFPKVEGQPGSDVGKQFVGQPGSQGFAKIEGQEVADAKGGGEGSKGGGKGSFQTGGAAGQKAGLLLPAVQMARRGGLPAGKTFAQLGFGVGSQAHLQRNAIIIVGGSQANGSIIAVLTPAGR
jgi:hypothetical protein